MGEISFLYQAKSLPRAEQGFRYWYSNTTKYGFAYQRYITLSDTSIINSPVAITKVAAGLSSLYGLFVTNREPMMPDGLDGFNVYKNPKETVRDINTYVKQEGQSIIEPLGFPDFVYSSTIRNKLNIYDTDSHLQRGIDINETNYGMMISKKNFRESMNVWKQYSSRYDKVANVYYQLNTSIDRNSLNILPIFNICRPNTGVVHYENVFGQTHSLKMNIYDNQNSSRDDNIANIYDNQNSSRDDNSMNIIETHLANKMDPIGNKLKSMLAKPTRPITVNWFKNVFGKYAWFFHLNYFPLLTGTRAEYFTHNFDILLAAPGIKDTDVNALILSGTAISQDVDLTYNYLATRLSYVGEIYENVYGKNYGKDARVNYQLFGKNYGKHTNVNSQITGKNYGKHTNAVPYPISGKNYGKHAEINYQITGKNYFGKETAINNQYYARRYPTPTAYWDYVNWAVKEMKYAFYCNNATVDYAIKYLESHDAEVFAVRDRSGMFITNNVFGINDRKSMTTSSGVFAVTGIKSTGILYKNTFFARNGKSSSISGDGEFTIKWNKYMDVIVGNVFVNYVYRNMEILKTDKTLGYKDRSDMIISTTDVPIFKDTQAFNILHDSKFVIKDRLSLGPEWEFLFIHKVPKDMEIIKIPSGAIKPTYSMYVNKDSIFGLKTDYSLGPVSNDNFAFKIPYDVMMDRNNEFALKTIYHAWTDKMSGGAGGDMPPRHSSYFHVGLEAIKTQFEAKDLTNVHMAFKDWLPLDLINTITKGYQGLIIPCSKVRYQGFVDDVMEMATKTMHQANIEYDCATSVIPKNTAIPDVDLFCDKDTHTVFVDNRNYWAIKSALKSIISSDTLAFKDIHFMSIFNSYWGQKDTKNLYAFKQYLSYKDKMSLSLESLANGMFAFKDVHTLNKYNDIFINKDSQMCYFYYDVVAQKERLGMLLQQDTIVTQDPRKMSPFIDLTAFLDASVLNLYEPMLCVSPILEKMNLIDASNAIYREAYDVSEFANDFGNWVWTYESPDPFDHLNQLYGIDELLLPANDTRYEDFENIIFDKETLMPRDPVKIIDNTTFIARFPIHHPVEEYADIGRIYGDSAKEWENYFGIETDVLHEIFLKYYQIWQARVFEFSTMTMQQATKRMLDLLYSWITLYYPIDKMDQAFRVFRQIRWYSESAIIRNAQYIISYEYDTLRSNLHKGTCDIPNDLDENDTMFITQGVIRNNPAYLGQEASVTFTIDVPKNTWFKFSLTNQIGTVKVYVNDVLVGMYPKSKIGIVIELPYTTGTNYVKIVKEANHNIDSKFYIGNIEIPDASFKELSIKFDPVLREGNKPLNEVAKKLIEFANLHANRNEMYAMARRSNVGITETYKKMNEYWKNHHQNKSKGKRLTIKQV